MTFARKRIGESGESLAGHFLESRGMKILARNVRMRVGEIDILAEDGKTLVIVEVKTKSNSQTSTAEDKVDKAKQRKLRQLANELAGEYPDRLLRIDVVAINNFNSVPEINYIYNAVEG